MPTTKEGAEMAGF